MNPRTLLILLLVSFTTVSFAQRKNKKKSADNTQPTTLDPQIQKEYTPKASKKYSKGPTFESEEKFYERMALLEKTKRKNEKLQSLPQYSDPMYFGHKRPPKKHKPGKMRYCRECGIRH
jgi:hypothetical protein